MLQILDVDEVDDDVDVDDFWLYACPSCSSDLIGVIFNPNSCRPVQEMSLLCSFFIANQDRSHDDEMLLETTTRSKGVLKAGDAFVPR